MSLVIETITVSVGIASAVASAAFAIVSRRHSQRAMRGEASRLIARLYDECSQRRFEYPELLSMACHWRPEYLARIYEPGGPPPNGAGWARYYAYVELGLSYCNAVLDAHANRLMDEESYAGYHARLVRLFVVENFPIVSQLCSLPYVSERIITFVTTPGSSGKHHDWATAHAALRSTVT